jgi:hypothetical protein
LCFNTPDPKKTSILNTFKVRYNLKAQIESTEGNGVPVEIIKKNGDTVIATEKIQS